MTISRSGGGWDVVKIKAYLGVPKVCSHMVSLLAELQCDYLMHLAIENCVVIGKDEINSW